MSGNRELKILGEQSEVGSGVNLPGVANMAGLFHTKNTASLYHRSAMLFVLGTWAVMLAAGLAFVAHYGSNVPSWDDWDMVPTMTGVQPITASWLWSQHNEHRIPVPRLAMLALYRLFGCDFRVGMYFNVASTAALALILILAAQAQRGRWSWTDAFFPVLLLNWAQGVNFIWGWQVEFFLSTVLAGVVLLVILRTKARLTVRRALVAGGLLALLVGCGAHGLALVPVLSCWIAACGLIQWRSGEVRAKRQGLVILAIALATMSFAALYLVGYEPVPNHPFTPGLISTLRTGVQFFTMGFGPAVRAAWPYSGVAMIVLLLFSVVVVLWVIRGQPAERQRALGLLACLGAMGCLALALGLGRNGFEPRYVTLSVPALCCVYFVCSLYLPQKFSAWAQSGLLAATLTTLWLNTKSGIDYAEDLRTRLGSLEREMANGVPSYRLICEYGPYLHIHQEMPTDYMPLLRRVGTGSFQFLRDNPPFREISIPLVPSEMSEATWDSGTAHLTGARSRLVFRLPEERHVCGIRLRYSHSNRQGILPCVGIYWKNKAQEAFSQEQYWRHSPTGDRCTWERASYLRSGDPQTTLIVWTCAPISEVRIDPDFRPGLFQISELLVLVAEEASPIAPPSAARR